MLTRRLVLLNVNKSDKMREKFPELVLCAVCIACIVFRMIGSTVVHSNVRAISIETYVLMAARRMDVYHWRQRIIPGQEPRLYENISRSLACDSCYPRFPQIAHPFFRMHPHCGKNI